MEYLLLAFVIIIVYAEIIPTLTILFDLIRTYFANKIAIIQQYTLHAQEDIQNAQARMEQSNSVAIGFHAPQTPLEMEEDDE